MRLLIILLALVPLLVSGEESYFFKYAKGPRPADTRIEGTQLHFVFEIEKLEPPKALAIYAARQDLGPGRKYLIQVDLAEPPAEHWLPMVKLGDDIVTKGMYVSSPGKADHGSYTLETDDPTKVRQWCHLLGVLLKLPQDKIELELPVGEGADEVKPATPLKAQADGDKKPKSETKPDHP